MTAVILAGGKGTRLAPYNTVFPKPLVPLGDRPILDIIIRQLVHYGFDRIVVSLGYLGELIEAYFRNGSAISDNLALTFVREREPLGTVGSLALVPNLTAAFLVMNGDVLTTLDFAKLLAFHKVKGGELTIAMHRQQVHLDLGLMTVDENSELHKFEEKPTLEYLVSMGVYVYEPTVLEYIRPPGYLDFPEVVWRMLRDGRRIVGYPSEDYWLDLGSHADYQKAQEEFEARRGELLF